VIYGCTGTSAFGIIGEYETEETTGIIYNVEISGLLGGHPADSIGLNHANAIILAMDFLDGCPDVRIVSLMDSLAPMTIPDYCNMVFVSSMGADQMSEYAKTKADQWNAKYADDDIRLDVTSETGTTSALTNEDSKALIKEYLAVPNGVGLEEEGAILASSNLALISLEDGLLLGGVICRTMSAEMTLYYYSEYVKAFGDDCYILPVVAESEWLGEKDCELIDKASAVYKRMTGKDAWVTICHGGLECKVFAERNPEMQIVSLGPTINNAHSIHESMSVESLHATKTYVFELIKTLR